MDVHTQEDDKTQQEPAKRHFPSHSIPAMRTSTTTGISPVELDTQAQWIWLSGRLGEAIDCYLDIARIYPKFAHIHFKLGYLYLTLQDYTSAIKHFSIEIERYGSNSLSNSTSTSSTTTSAPTQRGEAVATMVLQQVSKPYLNQKNFLFCSYRGRSEAYKEMDQEDKAEKDLSTIECRDGNSLTSLTAMGALYRHFAMFPRAEECFEMCAEIDSNNAEYLVEHADLRLAQRRFMNAFKMYEKARNLCETNVSVLFHRAMLGESICLVRLKRYHQANDLLFNTKQSIRLAIIKTRQEMMDRVRGNSVSLVQAPGSSSESGNTSSTSSSSSSSNMGQYSSSNDHTDGCGGGGSNFSSNFTLTELQQMFFQAINLYGGLGILRGDLNSSLETYKTVLEGRTEVSASSVHSKMMSEGGSGTLILPTICVIPGTKDQGGNLVDTSCFSKKNFSELIRHLNELELRYGPDVLLYFHRANAHKAMGHLELFIKDLTLVDKLDPNFLRMRYFTKESFGDFLEWDTICFVPCRLLTEITYALERQEYRLPVSRGISLVDSSDTTDTGSSAIQDTSSPVDLKHFSEYAFQIYFQTRCHYFAQDEYASVHVLDVMRRLHAGGGAYAGAQQSPLMTAIAAAAAASGDIAWEGQILDDCLVTGSGSARTGSAADKESEEQQDNGKGIVRNHVDHHIKNAPYGNVNPCVYMVAGMLELEQFNASAAQEYLTQAITMVDNKLIEYSNNKSNGTSSSTSDTMMKWQEEKMLRVKYYCLVWRSMASRIKIDMEKAVEDLNLAALILPGDALLLIQRTLIMFLNGYLKSAFKMLKTLEGSSLSGEKNTRRPSFVQQHIGTSIFNSSSTKAEPLAPMEMVDMFGNVGLNSFRLLPVELQKSLSKATTYEDDSNGEDSHIFSSGIPHHLQEEESLAANALGANGRVANGLFLAEARSGNRPSSANGNNPVDTLDKFYDLGLIKLATTGSLNESLPYFQAVLSMEENYLPPTNFASLELFKCKEKDFLEEKVFNCYQKLKKRSKWLKEKVKWKFEAFIDANLAHAYLPSDLEILWYRAHLYQEQYNFHQAVTDLAQCLSLMQGTSVIWDPYTGKATFPHEAKRTLWLSLLLEKGSMEMQMARYEQAVQDLTFVINYAPSMTATSRLLLEKSLEARSQALIHLKRYSNAIQDLEVLLNNQKNAPRVLAVKLQEEIALNCLLIGNLYCQLALDECKRQMELDTISSATSSTNKRASDDLPAATTTTTTSPFSNMAGGTCTEFPFYINFTNGSMGLLFELSQNQMERLHPAKGLMSQAMSYYDQATSVCLRSTPVVPTSSTTPSSNASNVLFLVMYFKGRLHALCGHTQSAIQLLSDCLKNAPSFFPALFLRANIHAMNKLVELALADFFKLKTLFPMYPKVLTNIGYCYLLKGHVQKAIGTLSEALQFYPKDLEASYLRGIALMETLAFDSAIKDFDVLLNTSCQGHGQYENQKALQFRGLYQKAVCFVYLKQYQKAMDTLFQVLTQEPQWTEALELYAYTAFCMEKFEESVFYYKKAFDTMSLNGNNSNSIMMRLPFSAGNNGTGDGSSPLRRYVSRLLLNKAMALYYNSKETLSSGKSMKQQQTLREQALTDLDLAVKKSPENYLASLVQAFVLLDLQHEDKKEKAIKCLMHCLPHYRQFPALLPANAIVPSFSSTATSSAVAVTTSTFRYPNTSGEGSDSLDEKRQRQEEGEIKDVQPQEETQSQGLEQERDERALAKAECLFQNRRQERKEWLNTSRLSSSIAPPQPSIIASLSTEAAGTVTTPASGASRSVGSRMSMSTVQSQQQQEIEVARRKLLIRKRFHIAMKQITFKYRVLSALEYFGNQKQKKNQAFEQLLKALLHQKNPVTWPQGILTFNILVWAFNALGIFHFTKRQMDDALMSFSLAIQADSMNFVSHFNRSNVYLSMKLYPSAVHGYHDAIKAAGTVNCFQAYNNLGICLCLQKRLEESMEPFQTSLTLVDNYLFNNNNSNMLLQQKKAIVCFNIGFVYQHLCLCTTMLTTSTAIPTMKQMEEAMGFYSLAIEMDTSQKLSVFVYNNKAMLSHFQLKFQTSLEEYTHAFQQLTSQNKKYKKKNTLILLINRAQLYSCMGNCTQAMDDLTKILSLLKTTTTSKDLFKQDEDDEGQVDVDVDDEMDLMEVDTLTHELLCFCTKWQHALKMALKDFVHALTAFDFMKPYRFTTNQSVQQLRLHPIVDTFCFDYTKAKEFLKAQKVFDMCSTKRDGHLSRVYDDNVEWKNLLKAHYQVQMDSKEEYLFLFMRLYKLKEKKEFTMSIHILTDFLVERRTKEEFELTCQVIRLLHDDEKELTATKQQHYVHNHSSSEHHHHYHYHHQYPEEWFETRRLVRADLYVELGCLYMLTQDESQPKIGNYQKALNAFLTALAIRSDHSIALLNAIQLKMYFNRSEQAMEFMIKLMDIWLKESSSSFTTVKQDDDPDLRDEEDEEGLVKHTLFNQPPRTNVRMIPHIFEALTKHPQVKRFAMEMLVLFKEYKNLLTQQIHTNMHQICKRQGTLIRLVQQLKQVYKEEEQDSVNNDTSTAKHKAAIARRRKQSNLLSPVQYEDQVTTNTNTNTTTVDLTLLNEKVDHLLNMSTTTAEASTKTKHHNNSQYTLLEKEFQQQYQKVCEEVAKSLELTTDDGQDTTEKMIQMDNLEQEIAQMEALFLNGKVATSAMKVEEMSTSSSLVTTTTAATRTIVRPATVAATGTTRTSRGERSKLNLLSLHDSSGGEWSISTSSSLKLSTLQPHPPNSTHKKK